MTQIINLRKYKVVEKIIYSREYQKMIQIINLYMLIYK